MSTHAATPQAITPAHVHLAFAAAEQDALIELIILRLNANFPTLAGRRDRALLRALLEDIQTSPTPLNLHALARTTTILDFAHDIGGISNHYDFHHQRFTNGFTPRTLAPKAHSLTGAAVRETKIT